MRYRSSVRADIRAVTPGFPRAVTGSLAVMNPVDEELTQEPCGECGGPFERPPVPHSHRLWGALLMLLAACAGPGGGGAQGHPDSSPVPAPEPSVSPPEISPFPSLEPPSPSIPGKLAQVTSVTDGDTVEVLFRGRSLNVRLIGIDTPETVAPGEPVQCYGPEASAFTDSRLERRPVRLEFDVERVDQYARTLAYVWLGDRLFNELLVRRGFATVTTYPPNVKYVDRFVAAQRVARNADRGLWGECGGPGQPSGGGGAGGGGGGRDGQCTGGYSPCLPPASDYDCAGGEGDGPEYTSTVTVTGSDPYGLDGDGDGVGCE